MNGKTVLCQLNDVISTSTTYISLSFLLFFCSFKAPIFCIFYNTHKYAYVHICMYIQCTYNPYTGGYVCICAHTHTCICKCICLYVYTHVDMWVCVSVRISWEPLFSIIQSLTHSSRNLGLAGTIGSWYFLLSLILFSEFPLQQPTGKRETCFIPDHHGK